MKQLENSSVSLLSLNDNEKEGKRSFLYNLNKKRTKAKLLKGAKRMNNLEVEVKSMNCVSLLFNDGSFFDVVLPLLRDWNQQIGKTVTLQGYDMFIVDVESGHDESDNIVDAIVKVSIAEHQVVMHAYNTSQSLLIQGKNCQQFVLKGLEPLLSKRISETLGSIKKFNN